MCDMIGHGCAGVIHVHCEMETADISQQEMLSEFWASVVDIDSTSGECLVFADRIWDLVFHLGCFKSLLWPAWFMAAAVGAPPVAEFDNSCLHL